MIADDKSLRTQRLRLAPVDASNAKVLWELMQTPELRTYQDLPVMEWRHFRALVTSSRSPFRSRKAGRFEWILHAERDEPIGWVSLRVGEHALESGEIGYSLLAEYRGRGLATEAVQAVIDEAFSKGKLRRLHAYCLPENAASRALLRRIGFREEGVVRKGASLRGRAVDVVSYSLGAQGR
jgi:[ribosomal protein S5]-alanine N-acetyltransferase